MGLSQSRDALIRVGHWTRSREIEVLLLGDLKSSRAEEFVNLAVQMATAADALPKWCYSILPARDIGIG